MKVRIPMGGSLTVLRANIRQPSLSDHSET